MDYIVIGLSNNPDFVFNDEVKSLLSCSRVFSGGKRHYGLVKKDLPAEHQWIEIKSDMPALFQQYKQVKATIIVFASGDPLFYGFANTLKTYHPEAKLKIYPYFNSLQLLCQKCHIAYQSMINTSVHGRSWQELDVALIRQNDLIGVLTDPAKTPAVIARRMLEYNFNGYKMIVAEALEGDNEKISFLTLEKAAEQTFDSLNCVILIKTEHKSKPFGIPDAEFTGLENRPNMITKMPIRMVSLSQLDLHNRKHLWDIGFCTASIAIEAKKQFPHLQITAFEKRTECDELYEINTRKHAVPGITKIMGDFFKNDFKELSSPDAVFIGGHGNKLEELIQLTDKYLLPGGRMVINAVKDDSKEVFIKSIQQLNYKLLQPIVIAVDEHNPITILTAEKSQYK